MNAGALMVAIALASAAAAGCVSKSKARTEAAKAYAAGQAQALQALQKQNPTVTFVGEVRQRVVPWQEGMTLAQAIDAAQYTGISDPRAIILTRGVESVEIKTAELLRGAVNPELQAGDIVELRR